MLLKSPGVNFYATLPFSGVWFPFGVFGPPFPPHPKAYQLKGGVRGKTPTKDWQRREGKPKVLIGKGDSAGVSFPRKVHPTKKGPRTCKKAEYLMFEKFPREFFG